jgi:hypothetical protein
MPIQSTPVEFWLEKKPVRVNLRLPSSLDAGAMRECSVGGQIRGELLAPITAFVESQVMPRYGLRLAWAGVVDSTREESTRAVFEASVPALAVDPRSERGWMVVSHGKYSDYYCIDVTETTAEVTVSLDNIKGLAP